jgi:hypothetical protein
MTKLCRACNQPVGGAFVEVHDPRPGVSGRYHVAGCLEATLAQLAKQCAVSSTVSSTSASTSGA